MQQKKPKRRRVTFMLDAPQAGEVCLMGDFNNWDALKHPMKRGKNGIWGKIVYLPPGRYEYKFLVDGRWNLDPEIRQLCRNCYGTSNNFIIVSLGQL
jgi:1,4-alpha-glucan branching enzyme